MHRPFQVNATDPVQSRYRGRFAPSPTGPLHFGSLIAALASHCDARKSNGEWLVRIEDVDVTRSRPGAADSILRTLERYGFEWDGPIVHQSERTALYDAALARLVELNATYPCACSRRELETAALGAGGERVYPGTCRDGITADRRQRRERAWRVRVAGDAVDSNGEQCAPADAGARAHPLTTIGYHDRAMGPQSQDLLCDVGDFVVRRADGLYAYQLAVVVDDALQGVNAIVRGADLLSSTPRQIHLQRLLGYATPSYLHVPVALDANGMKLSKQTRAAPLPEAPLPALLAAWRFLDQPPPDGGDNGPGNVIEFWDHACSAWTVERLPKVLELPFV